MKINSTYQGRAKESAGPRKESKNLSSLLGKPKKIPDGKKEMLFSELLSLLSSGVDFSRAFGMLAEGEKDKNISGLLNNIHHNIIKGDTLGKSLSSGGYFTALDCGVVRIGEETGKLYESLGFLSDYYRKKASQKRMISSAVSYPLIILFIAVVVLVFMMLVVVPMFEQVYSRMGGELPALTRVVVAFSRNFKSYLLAFALTATALTVLSLIYGNTEPMRKFKATLLLKAPLAGNLIKKNSQAHFCKLMYLLHSSGIPLISGIEMLQDIITLYPYRKSFESMARGLTAGESFADNVARFGNLYDTKLTTLLRVGEETNTLSQMLRKQGEDLTAELDYKLKQLGNILEPVMIMFIGVLVAVILISMYLPMFKLGTTIY